MANEEKLTLPTGHPSAGYVEPDLSYHEGTGTIPDEEKDWHDDRNEARQADVDAVAKAEDEAARKEIAEREKAEAKTSDAESSGTAASSSAKKTP